MRITAGKYKNVQLVTPKNMAVRPASDKVRQAVFNSLLSRIDLNDVHVLDGFCGTGSYGLEALSRGAKFVTFIDQDISLVIQNINLLELHCHTSFIKNGLQKVKANSGAPVQLCFLDPPYKQNLLELALTHLQKQGWIDEDTLCVLECEKDLIIPDSDSRTYGDVQIIFHYPSGVPV